MNPKIAFVFPGQGSQSVGMLNGFAQNSVVQQSIQLANTVLNEDIGALIQNGPVEALALTENTQPVMLLSSVAMYRAFLAAGGPIPELVAGHSLGEYSALVASNAMTLEQALPLVRFRAKSMQEAVPVGSGGMAAIVGMSDAAVSQLCAEVTELTGKIIEPVNFNAPSQVVVAGYIEAVDQLVAMAKPAGAKLAIKLQVSAPFHSSLLKPAAKQLQDYLTKVVISQPTIDLINNVDVAIEHTPDRVIDALIRQACSPVRWVETIEKMAASGITYIVECGPGKVLSGLVKRIAPQIQIRNISDLESMESFLSEIKN